MLLSLYKAVDFTDASGRFNVSGLRVVLRRQR